MFQFWRENFILLSNELILMVIIQEIRTTLEFGNYLMINFLSRFWSEIFFFFFQKYR